MPVNVVLLALPDAGNRSLAPVDDVLARMPAVALLRAWEPISSNVHAQKMHSSIMVWRSLSVTPECALNCVALTDHSESELAILPATDILVFVAQAMDERTIAYIRGPVADFAKTFPLTAVCIATMQSLASPVENIFPQGVVPNFFNVADSDVASLARQTLAWVSHCVPDVDADQRRRSELPLRLLHIERFEKLAVSHYAVVSGTVRVGQRLLYSHDPFNTVNNQVESMKTFPAGENVSFATPGMHVGIKTSADLVKPVPRPKDAPPPKKSADPTTQPFQVGSDVSIRFPDVTFYCVVETSEMADVRDGPVSVVSMSGHGEAQILHSVKSNGLARLHLYFLRNKNRTVCIENSRRPSDAIRVLIGRSTGKSTRFWYAGGGAVSPVETCPASEDNPKCPRCAVEPSLGHRPLDPEGVFRANEPHERERA